MLRKICCKKILIFSLKSNFKHSDDLKLEYNWTNETYFQWLQLKHAIPHKWKANIKQNPGNVNNLFIQHYYLIKGAQILKNYLPKNYIQY